MKVGGERTFWGADFDEGADENTKVLLGKNMELHEGGEEPGRLRDPSAPLKKERSGEAQREREFAPTGKGGQRERVSNPRCPFHHETIRALPLYRGTFV